MNGRPLVVVVVSVLCFAGWGDPDPEAADRVQVLTSQVAEAFHVGDYAKARSLWREVVTRKPDFAEAWVEHGMACAAMQDHACARESYERALQLHAQRYRENPDDANQLQQQVYVLFLLGRDAEARALLTQGLERHPEDPQLALFPSALENLLTASEFRKIRVPRGLSAMTGSGLSGCPAKREDSGCA